MLQEFRFNYIIVIRHHAFLWQCDDELLFFVESEGVIFHVMDLPVDCERADDEDDGDDDLSYDKQFSRPCTFPSFDERAAKNHGRVESGEEESGVDAGCYTG